VDSERDFPLKIQMRRLFWMMGVSTSLDVKLRAHISGDSRSPGWQEYTDLDVLGVGFSPTGEPHIMLADCKTSSGRAIERMFWVRGVADFFSADAAFMVRTQPVPAAARTLSNRIDVAVLDPDDYRALASTYSTSLDFDGPLRHLFDVNSVRHQMDSYSGLPKKLNSLVEFTRFDYWTYEPYRNLTQVVAHLADAVSVLDPNNPAHVALFLENAWLFVFALAQATHHVRTSRMADVPFAVSTYVAGGELAKREKAQLAQLLRQAGFNVDSRSSVLPPYIDSLTELITRFLVRPAEIVEVLRYAEYLITASVVGETATVGEAFGTNVRPIAAKLLADACGFLVTAAGLRPAFRVLARERLIIDLTGGNSAVQVKAEHLTNGPAEKSSSITQMSLPIENEGESKIKPSALE
jgi:hypothetical protein